jgi:signal peptidase I
MPHHNRSIFSGEPLLPGLSNNDPAVLFEDILGRNLGLRVKVTGKSMSPVLQGGEIVTIQKVQASLLQIGDLIFYKTREGIPLLHRIVGKQREKDMFIFHTKGDALMSTDEPVTEDNVLGKVCRIEIKCAPGETKNIDMESHVRRIINYLLAKKSLIKSKAYLSVQRCPIYPSLRSIIKKTLV